ncbi:MAG TPA: CvpA family protein [Chthoniobacterales bacterium]|nr:CvpA family protein [Chthoniobacterales bacterium]
MSGIGADGSEYWRNVFFALAGGWVLLSFLRGWTQGVLRQLLVPLAVFGALVAVIVVTPTASGYLYQNTRLPASALLLGFAIWLFAYNLLVFVGGIIFKRTRDQDLAIVRLVFGVGGAIIAVVYAFLQIWVIVVGIRILGRFAEDQVAVQSSRNAVSSGLVVGLARLKNSLELGSGKVVLDQLDPVPPEAYRRLDQCTQLLANPRAIGRLLESPALRGIWENPRIQALQADPEISQAIRRGDFLSILSNSKVFALWTDPSIRALLSGDQIQAACDYAKEEAKE